MSSSNGTATLDQATLADVVSDVDIPDVDIDVVSEPVFDADAASVVSESFETAFAEATPEMRERYRKFGATGKDLLDPTSKVGAWVSWSHDAHDIMVAERNAEPGKYDRSVVTKRLANALLYSDAPSYNPNQLIPLFWVVHLDCSTPGDAGEARTFNPIPADYYSGNLSNNTLKILSKYIKRESDSDEIDVFEYLSGWESTIRGAMTKLRAGTLGRGGLESLLAKYDAHLKSEADRKRKSALSPERVEQEERVRVNREQDAKYEKLRSIANDLHEHAVAISSTPEGVRDILVQKGVIPAPAQLGVEAIARTITPGDAKQLVQRLMELSVFDPSRTPVVLALAAEIKIAVNQIKSTQAAKAG